MLLLTLFFKQQLDTKALLLEALKRRRRTEEGLFVGALRCLPMLSMHPPKSRKLWMKVRSKDWWERVVLLEFSDLEWKQNFRMTHFSFTKLCGLVDGFMAPDVKRKVCGVISTFVVVLFSLIVAGLQSFPAVSNLLDVLVDAGFAEFFVDFFK